MRIVYQLEQLKCQGEAWGGGEGELYLYCPSATPSLLDTVNLYFFDLT